MKTKIIGQAASKRTLPYTFARVSVMKSKLIKPDEYYKLLKMDLASITRYLQDSQYKDSITKFSDKYKGVDLMDISLRRNQRLAFEKLRKISPQEVVDVINLYLNRFDFHNDKVVMRGIYSNASRDEVVSLLQTIGQYKKNHFLDLFETGSIEKVIENATMIDSKSMEKALDDFKRNNRLIKIENELDKQFYQYSIQGASQLTTYSDQFKRFVLRKIDMINVKNLLRFKKEGMAVNEVIEHMIFDGQRLKEARLRKLANASSYEELIKMLKKTYYHRYVDFNDDAVYDIERRLLQYYMKSYSRKSNVNNMSIECVLSYLMNKIIEVKNLRYIIKSKHFGIDEEYVEKKMLIL